MCIIGKGMLTTRLVVLVALAGVSAGVGGRASSNGDVYTEAISREVVFANDLPFDAVSRELVISNDQVAEAISREVVAFVPLFDIADVLKALRAAGGSQTVPVLDLAHLNPIDTGTSAGQVDMLDAAKMMRVVTGLDPHHL